jgi:hypothetical protein
MLSQQLKELVRDKLIIKKDSLSESISCRVLFVCDREVAESVIYFPEQVGDKVFEGKWY